MGLQDQRPQWRSIISLDSARPGSRPNNFEPVRALSQAKRIFLSKKFLGVVFFVADKQLNNVDRVFSLSKEKLGKKIVADALLGLIL